MKSCLASIIISVITISKAWGMVESSPSGDKKAPFEVVCWEALPDCARKNHNTDTRYHTLKEWFANITKEVDVEHIIVRDKKEENAFIRVAPKVGYTSCFLYMAGSSPITLFDLKDFIVPLIQKDAACMIIPVVEDVSLIWSKAGIKRAQEAYAMLKNEPGFKGKSCSLIARGTAVPLAFHLLKKYAGTFSTFFCINPVVRLEEYLLECQIEKEIQERSALKIYPDIPLKAELLIAYQNFFKEAWGTMDEALNLPFLGVYQSGSLIQWEKFNKMITQCLPGETKEKHAIVDLKDPMIPQPHRVIAAWAVFKEKYVNNKV